MAAPEKGKGMLALVLSSKGKGAGASGSKSSGNMRAADIATDAGEGGEVNEGMRAAAESLVAAITSGDTEGVALALKDFYDNC